MENKKLGVLLLSGLLLVSMAGFALASSGISGSDNDKDIRIEKDVNGLETEVRIENNVDDDMDVDREFRLRVRNDETELDKEVRIKIEKDFDDDNDDNNPEVRVEVRAEKEVGDSDSEFRLEKEVELENGKIVDIEVRAPSKEEAHSLLEWVHAKLEALKSMPMTM